MAYGIKILSTVSHKWQLDEYQAPAPAAGAVGPCLFAPEVPPALGTLPDIYQLSLSMARMDKGKQRCPLIVQLPERWAHRENMKVKFLSVDWLYGGKLGGLFPISRRKRKWVSVWWTFLQVIVECWWYCIEQMFCFQYGVAQSQTQLRRLSSSSSSIPINFLVILTFVLLGVVLFYSRINCELGSLQAFLFPRWSTTPGTLNGNHVASKGGKN